MISIREDFRLFTHQPGKQSVIPRSKAWMRVYPCLIEICTENETLSLELDLHLVKDFTHLLNIEKGRVEVFGQAKEGYFHLWFFARNGEVVLSLKRGKSLLFKMHSQEVCLNKGDEVALLKTTTINEVSCLEKLSFGCYKKPLLEKNMNVDAKLFLLAQQMPEENIVSLDDEKIKALLVDLCAPQTCDKYHQGLGLGSIAFDRFSLFSTVKKRVREALFIEHEDRIDILKGGKTLPIAGRVVGIKGDGFKIDFLWRKNKIIRCVIHPEIDGKKRLNFARCEKRYRIKTSLRSKGKFVDADAFIELKAGQKVFIDRVT